MLAPVAVIAVAAAVGLTVISHQNGGSSSFSSSSGGAEAGKAASARTPLTGVAPSATLGTAIPAPTPATDLGARSRRYAVVVVARARAMTDHAQAFRIVRRLKGAAPTIIILNVTSAPAKVGALHVLFLDPLPATPSPPTPAPSTSPAPTPSGSELPSPLGSAPAVPDTALPSPIATPPPAPELAFTYQGQTAVVQRLPAGTDAASVTLP